MKRHYIVALLGLFVTFFVFECVTIPIHGERLTIDLIVQDFFYQGGSWFIDENQNRVLHFIFYDGIKILLVIIGIISLFSSLYWFYKKKNVQARRALYITLSLAVIPASISVLKVTTNVYIPAKITRYGGRIPYVKTFEAYPDDFVPPKPGALGRGFPAGHASGGFALIALVFLTRTKRETAIAWALVLCVGWSMGLYQVGRGEHYLSHNFFTFFIAWLIAALLAQILLPKKDNKLTV